jgi:hypothetical protein
VSLVGKRLPKAYQGTTSPTSLALDLETYAEPKIGRKGRITSTADALDPRKAEIRLVTVGDQDGNIRQFDLRGSAQLPPEIMRLCAAQKNLSFTMPLSNCSSSRRSSGSCLSRSFAR